MGGGSLINLHWRREEEKGGPGNGNLSPEQNLLARMEAVLESCLVGDEMLQICKQVDDGFKKLYGNLAAS